MVFWAVTLASSLLPVAGQFELHCRSPIISRFRFVPTCGSVYRTRCQLLFSSLLREDADKESNSEIRYSKHCCANHQSKPV